MRLFSKRKKKSSYESLFISREAYEAIRGELEKEIENLTGIKPIHLTGLLLAVAETVDGNSILFLIPAPQLINRPAGDQDDG